MTNQQTNVANAAETTLSSALAAGATTINVVDGASFPAVPFYIVLDPGKDTTREVALVDSAKTATTFTLSAPAMRGLDGTTDTNHDAGAVVAMVPVAALWTDINDRVDAGDAATTTVQGNLDTHAGAANPHSGSASVSSVTTVQTNLDTHEASVAPHSATTDPTANRLALRNASGQASFADPSTVQHAATKNYVDTADTTHANLTSPHSATAAATADRLVVRDAAGRAAFATPSAAGDAATKGYVDGLAPFAPTYAAITRTTVQSIANASDVQVQFTATEAESPTTFGDHAAYRLVIPATGFYDFGAVAQWATNTSGERFLYIYVNGVVTDVGDSRDATAGPVRMTASDARQFTASDVITAFVQQTSGGPLDLSAARLWAHRVG